MSLLLDALKEAEAQKREAASARAPTTVASFETDGALALAEYVAVEPVDAVPTVTSRIMPAAPAAPAVNSAPAPAPAASPADLLLAARAARAGSSASPPATTRAPLVAAPAATAAVPSAASPPAAKLAPAPGKAGSPRAGLPWLIGCGVALALLVAALFVYDRWANSPAAPGLPPAEAFAPVTSAAPVSPDVAGAPALPSAADSTSFLTTRAAPSGPRALPLEPARERGRTREPAAGSESRAPVPASSGAGPEPVRISISREAAPLEAAFVALQSGDLVRAEALYLQVLASEPDQADAQLGLAVISQSRGDDAAALRGFRRVLESVPDQPRAWAGLAELAGEGETGTIESRLRQLLADRSSAPLHFALGNLLARQQRWDDAQVEYFAAASLAPQAPDYAFNVAVALERIGKPQAALPWYRRSLELVAAGRAARFDPGAVRARIQGLQAASP